MPGRVTLWGSGQIFQSYFSRELATASLLLHGADQGRALRRRTFLALSWTSQVGSGSYQRVEIPNNMGYWVS